MQGSKCVFTARQQSPLHMLWSVLTSIESNSAKVEEFRWQGNIAQWDSTRSTGANLEENL